MDAPDHIVVEMSIASAQEDERIKAIEFDRMTDQTTKYGFDTNVQYDETALPHFPYQRGLNSNPFLVLNICIGCKFLTNQ